MRNGYYIMINKHDHEKELRQHLMQFKYSFPGVEYTTSSEFTMNPELEEEGILGADIFDIPEDRYAEALKLVGIIYLSLKKNFGIHVSIILHTKQDTEKYYRNILDEVLHRRELFSYHIGYQIHSLVSFMRLLEKKNEDSSGFDKVKGNIQQIIACEV